jgi:hypothetical protein
MNVFRITGCVLPSIKYFMNVSSYCSAALYAMYIIIWYIMLLHYASPELCLDVDY